MKDASLRSACVPFTIFCRWRHKDDRENYACDGWLDARFDVAGNSVRTVHIIHTVLYVFPTSAPGFQFPKSVARSFLLKIPNCGLAGVY